MAPEGRTGQSRLKCRPSFRVVLTTVTPPTGRYPGGNCGEIRQLLQRDSEVGRKAARLRTLVIPAQAGIHETSLNKSNVAEKPNPLDSGFRRKDPWHTIIFVVRPVPKTKNKTRLPCRGTASS